MFAIKKGENWDILLEPICGFHNEWLTIRFQAKSRVFDAFAKAVPVFPELNKSQLIL